jgi:hypothetical protein
MPRYDVACENCGTQETVARMADVRGTRTLDCPVCERPRPRLIVVPQFQEDRLRFWKGPTGNGYSHALGARMPDSREARDRLAKERGVEFITLAEHLGENKEAAQAVEYRAHVDAGGERVEQRPADTMGAFVPKPAWAKELGV